VTLKGGELFVCGGVLKHQRPHLGVPDEEGKEGVKERMTFVDSMSKYFFLELYAESAGRSSSSATSF